MSIARVTPSMIFDQLNRALQRNLEDMNVLNTRLSSGRKFNKPSDDVIGVMRAMDYKLSINNNGQYERNMDEASFQLGFIDNVLTSVADSLQQVSDDAITGATGAESAESMAAMARGVLGLRDHLLNLANSKVGNRYLFSGFKTGTAAFNTANYAYQGDSGEINVPIDRSSTVPVNIPGSTAFSYTLNSEEVVQLQDGKYIHYIPGGGTTVDVEIRDTDDTTVIDSFSFSNFIQMTDILGSALQDNNSLRAKAMTKPFDDARDSLLNVQAGNGVLQVRLEDQKKRLDESTLDLKNVLDDTQNADLAETISSINKTEIALEALRLSSAKVLSPSLLDFLK